MLMSEIEIITDGGRRRRWSAADKLRIVEETMFEGRAFPPLRVALAWLPICCIVGMRRDQKTAWGAVFPDELMLEGGSIAVAADDSVTGNKTVRDMDARIRELERQLGRKTMEVEILQQAFDKSRAKAGLCPPLVRGQWRATLLAQSLKGDELP
jgi:transposase